MNTREAHAILNAVKAGLDMSRRQIDRALRVTGDLPSCYRSRREFFGIYGELSDEGDSWPVVRRFTPAGQWERCGAGLLRRATPFDALMA